jgi:hypothetical protein
MEDHLHEVSSGSPAPPKSMCVHVWTALTQGTAVPTRQD